MIKENEDHHIKELEQEKMILEEINAHLEKMDKKNIAVIDILNQDIRTPLVVIKVYTDMFLDNKFGNINEIQREKLMRMKENIESLINAVFETIEKNKCLRTTD